MLPRVCSYAFLITLYACPIVLYAFLIIMRALLSMLSTICSIVLIVSDIVMFPEVVFLLLECEGPPPGESYTLLEHDYPNFL